MTKIDIINSSVHRNEHNLVTSGQHDFLLWNLHIVHTFAHHYCTTEIQLFEAFSPTFSSNKMTMQQKLCYDDILWKNVIFIYPVDKVLLVTIIIVRF